MATHKDSLHGYTQDSFWLHTQTLFMATHKDSLHGYAQTLFLANMDTPQGFLHRDFLQGYTQRLYSKLQTDSLHSYKDFSWLHTDFL